MAWGHAVRWRADPVGFDGQRGGPDGVAMTDADREAFDRGPTEAQIAALLVPTDVESRPNLGALAFRLNALDALALNIKFYGYEVARRLAAELPIRTGLGYAPVGLTSKPCTQADIESDWAAFWCGELRIPVIFHRKIWEFVFFLQALAEAGLMEPGRRALGFGCGEEPLASYLAAKGLHVTVTDLAPSEGDASAWRDTSQHAGERDMAFKPDLVDRATFDRLVDHRFVDMNAIPDDLADYDVSWSICALEHLGSIARGLDFIENALRPLRSGGVSIHTTEFNFLDDVNTIDNWPTVLPQRRHFSEIAARLRARGHHVAELDFDVGGQPMDRFIDLPPYPGSAVLDRLHAAKDCRHLKLSIDGFASTCFGLIVRKA